MFNAFHVPFVKAILGPFNRSIVGAVKYALRLGDEGFFIAGELLLYSFLMQKVHLVNGTKAFQRALLEKL